MWLLIFFITPIIEMYLLIEVAGYIDAIPTILLVMLTAVIGVALLKRQGLETLTRGVRRLEQGEIPAREMAEGILLAVAGALLVTPGFVTDTIGFLLLFPPTRMLIAGELLKRVRVGGAVQGATFHQDGFRQQSFRDETPPGNSRPDDGPVTLEGDYEQRDPR